ncbi:MAG: RHS repeat protein [Candidatus Schekmanbacteria bacterium]|nr:RHS repeat protein [Candidatus Schekmanbacteria bacterium]
MPLLLLYGMFSGSAVNTATGKESCHNADPVILGRDTYWREETDIAWARFGPPWEVPATTSESRIVNVTRRYSHGSVAEFLAVDPFLFPWHLNLFDRLTGIGSLGLIYLGGEEEKIVFVPRGTCLDDTAEDPECLRPCAIDSAGEFCSLSPSPFAVEVLRSGETITGYRLTDKQKGTIRDFGAIEPDAYHPAPGAAYLTRLCHAEDGSDCLTFEYDDNGNADPKLRLRRLRRVVDPTVGRSLDLQWSRAALGGLESRQAAACGGGLIAGDALDKGNGRLVEITSGGERVVSYCYQSRTGVDDDGRASLTNYVLERVIDTKGDVTTYDNDRLTVLNPYVYTEITRTAADQGAETQDTWLAYGIPITGPTGIYRPVLAQEVPYNRTVILAPATYGYLNASGDRVRELHTQTLFDIDPGFLPALLDGTLDPEDTTDALRINPSFVAYYKPNGTISRWGVRYGAQFVQGVDPEANGFQGMELYDVRGLPWVRIDFEGTVELIIWDLQRHLPLRIYSGARLGAGIFGAASGAGVNLEQARDTFARLRDHLGAMFDVLDELPDSANAWDQAEAALLAYLEQSLVISNFARRVDLTYQADRPLLTMMDLPSSLVAGARKRIWYDFDAAPGATPSGCETPAINTAPTRFVHRVLVQGWTESAPGVTVCKTVETRLTRAADGRVLTLDGPRADVTDTISFTYDSAGNLTAADRAGLLQYAFGSYHRTGQPGSIDYPGGVTIAHTFEPDGGLASESVKVGAQTLHELAYDRRLGRVMSASSGLGELLSLARDSWGRLAVATAGSGLTRQLSGYNSYGKPFSVSVHRATGEQLFRTDLAYDGMGRLRTVAELVDARRREVTTRRNTLGLVVAAETSLNGQVGLRTTYEYDALDRMITATTATDGGARRYTYEYDGGDQITRLIDPDGRALTRRTDDLGRLVGAASGDLGQRWYRYDDGGNLLQSSDGTQVVDFAYDAVDRLTAVTGASGTVVRVDYDAQAPEITAAVGEGAGNVQGRVAVLETPASRLAYAYLPGGNFVTRKVETVTAPGGQELTCHSAFAYDADWNIASERLCDGPTVEYAYGAGDLLSSISMRTDQGLEPVLSNVAKLAPHLVEATTFGNGVRETRAYEQFRETRWQVVLGESVLREQYRGYDPLTGYLRTIEDAASSTVAAFQYDALRRLVDAGYGDGARQLHYTYDGAGNRLRQSDQDNEGMTATSYSYEPGSNRLTAAGETALTYDLAGRVRTIGDTTYSYDELGNLTTAELPGGVTVRCGYDGRGRRVYKQTANETTFYVYGPDDTLGLIVSRQGQQESRVYAIWDPQRPFSPVALRFAGPPAETTYYLHQDALGAVQLATDAGGAVVWRAEYAPFGEAELYVNAIPAQAFRLPGHLADDETGLYYNAYRYYAPALGRYLTPDPALDGGIGGNFYVSEMLWPEDGWRRSRRGDGVPATLAETVLHDLAESPVLRDKDLSGAEPALVEVAPELATQYVYVANNPVNRRDLYGNQGTTGGGTTGGSGGTSGGSSPGPFDPGLPAPKPTNGLPEVPDWLKKAIDYGKNGVPVGSCRIRPTTKAGKDGGPRIFGLEIKW